MNSIELFKQSIPLLDEVYKAASLTADLDGDNSEVKAGANANELIIPKMKMDGLADYSRNSGYVKGDVTLTYETVACNFDRGRMFTVDALDNIETANIAFGKLSSEFIRTQVVPELDAFRLSKYASTEGISKANGNLTTGANVVEALRAGCNKLDEDEVDPENRILYITPTLKALVDDLDTTKSKAVLARFSKIVLVPQSRFYTAIAQNDGKTEGQTAGGYAKAEGATNINFLIVQKRAVIQFDKHSVPKIISPEANQTSDGWMFGYRNVGIAEVYENKAAGIYCHAANN